MDRAVLLKTDQKAKQKRKKFAFAINRKDTDVRQHKSVETL